jgi:hypothetical protein
MRRFVACAALVLAFGTPPVFAHAGVYTDDLSRCLVKSTTPADQTGFMVWMFSAISQHPSVKRYSTITDAQRSEASKNAAQLMQRLMTVDCRAETVASLKYEGETAISSAFQVFGGAAMRGLMGDPEVAKEMDALGEYIDASKFEALIKDAGIAPPAAK